MRGGARTYNEDLDAATRAQLARGQRANEVLKQVEVNPLSMEQQVSIFYLLTSGALDDVARDKVVAFEAGWHEYAAANIPSVLQEIASSGDLSDEASKKLDEAAAGYKQTAEL